MDVLVVGGTGPTGVPIVETLVEHGHRVTILHRGLHERPETPSGVAHRHADPYEEHSLAAELDGTRWDVVVAMYGRLRAVARVVRGRCGHFVSVGGVPAYLGWTDPTRHHPSGLPVPVAEDAPLVDDPAVDDKGYRIARTEAVVFELHPRAAHLRYPYLYGPHQPVPREWSVVRRILDGRRRLVVAEGGLTLHHHCYTANAAAAVVAAAEHPERSSGTVFNVGDAEVLSVRQVVELCAEALGAELEVVSLPLELAVPARPLLTQPSATHRVLDLTRLHHRLGHRDLVPAREAVPVTARWLAAHPPDRGGLEEQVLTDPFDYAAEDALMDGWTALTAGFRPPDFAVAPGFGLAYSGPGSRSRTRPGFEA